MVILPPGHANRPAGPRRLARRERWLLGGGGVVLAALAVVLVISLSSRQRVSGHGCIDVSAATVIGGSELYRCGAAARAMCAGGGVASREFASFQRALTAACRKAGLQGPGRRSGG